MGSLESIIKAALAEMVPRDRRATGYGLFNAGFGLFWLLGSVIMGLLYEFSLGSLVAFSVAVQLLAVPFFLAVGRKWGSNFAKPELQGTAEKAAGDQRPVRPSNLLTNLPLLGI